MYIPNASGGQKKDSDLVELELQMVVKHHVGAENRAQILYKGSKYSYLLRCVIFGINTLIFIKFITLKLLLIIMKDICYIHNR